MKNKIYTYLLFGISVAFSVTGYTQTKPASMHATAKTISAAPLQSKHTKPDNKKNTSAAPVKTKSNNKKNPISSKSTNKKDSIAVSKLTTQRKSASASKTTAKKQTIVSAKLKSNKQSIVSSKSSHKTNAVASLDDPSTRKHTVISSKSSESVSIKPLHYKKMQKHAPANLDLDNAESDQIIHTNNDKQFHRTLIDHPQITKINTAHVSIETSLFLDGLEADLSKELILQLTDIFAWDIDFATNLRPGDQFTVVYGKKIVDGKETDSDEIIAAEFINQGSSYTAVRYINEFGIASYYTPDGQSMQRAFLTTPVDFAKISSPFDMHRKHPILNRIRAHKGIDYAARIGTPVKTTGDGIVTFSGRKGAYGQVVIIQHNDHYETLYAHMSDFKKGLTVGNHVKQGDVIGFVGQTGLATGPHLHYEFHVDGLYRDPETVKIPHSMPISNVLLADFNTQTQPFFTQLAQAKAKSLFAKNPSAIAPGIALPPASMQSSRYD
ncbi:MAG: peptidoglycan DD-metalloendopeptidase family protein [Methylobacter sp.]|uniref:peptidoglycan DD-metalloendopeptidase family protein n=1 Tax=Methylobacter sp. TaxID=2051955 RepID=UPI00272FA99B|nr:peptidoglycan DD-metalloendopeptidase family protein [Methylobacter sp.]MDP1664465.1 peptidoglycan DD-metalloendopeptidase family protein [Methylobacter sp.]